MDKMFNVYAIRNGREMLVVVNKKEAWPFKKAVSIAEKFTDASKVQTKVKEVKE